MAAYRFKHCLGINLSSTELETAAALLSWGYTKWQNNPANSNPVTTDTSPAVYASMLHRGIREALLYYEADDELRGVFVHSMSPFYDQYPLRKLSYAAVRPTQRGWEPLKAVFVRYGDYMRSLGEDVIITSDLDQQTLNSLLDMAGFREVRDRNETYYLLSQLMFRQVFSAHLLASDFVVDEIIVLDGKAIRRNKKVLKLDTMGIDFYDVYCRQQRSRVERALPEENRELLRRGFERAQEGVFLAVDYVGGVAHEDGGAVLARKIFGHVEEVLPAETVDREAGVGFLLPGNMDDLRDTVEQPGFRTGFFDFLCYSFKILGSLFVLSGLPAAVVREALAHYLHPRVPLRHIDLVEGVLAPEAQVVPEDVRTFSDGVPRTAWRLTGPYAVLDEAGYHADTGRMLETVLDLKAESGAPLVCVGLAPGAAVERLATMAAERRQSVLAFDFGNALAAWAGRERAAGRVNEYFGVVPVRDYYQVPVMLEHLGLKPGLGIELDFTT